jgi:hypothetical protein
MFRIAFDFIDHRLVVTTSSAADGGFALEPMSVAAFHRRLVARGGRAACLSFVDAPFLHPNDRELT